MEFHEKHIILSLEGLIGEGNIFCERKLLQEALTLSKMKTFYQYKERKNDVCFDFDSGQETINLQAYKYLVMQILYILNFKKKFCSKNMNRIVSNYFKIFYKSIKRKVNTLTIPEYIINDESYLNTLALSNIYMINEFQHYEKKS